MFFDHNKIHLEIRKRYLKNSQELEIHTLFLKKKIFHIRIFIEEIRSLKTLHMTQKLI